MKIVIILVIFSITTLYSNDDIHWIQYADFNGSSSGIDNADSMNVMAVYDEGAVHRRVVKSTNGGRTWEEVFRESTKQPWRLSRDISYPSKDFCIIGSDSSQFLVTRNGGETWDTVNTGFGTTSVRGFHTVDMYDEYHGALSTIQHMIVSNDGFQTWDTIPPKGDAGDYYVLSLQMIDETTIAMINRDVDYDDEGKTLYDWRFFISYNSGKDWIEYPYPDYGIPRKLHFIDEQVGYCIGSLKTDLGNTRHDIIYKTADGGENWELIMDNYQTPRFGLQDVDFYDHDNGIVVGQFGKIYWTHDGGKTWIQDTNNVAVNRDPPVMNVCMLSPKTAVIADVRGRIYRGESGVNFVKTYDPYENNIKVIIDNSIARFIISTPNIGEAELEIVDINGRIVYTGNHYLHSEETSFDVDISGFVAGAYLYRVIQETEIIGTGKIIVK